MTEKDNSSSDRFSSVPILPACQSLNPSGTGVVEALLIEDNKYYSQLLSRMLSADPNCAYAIKFAENLKEAEEQLTAGMPQIIILDLHLPDSSGMDTLKYVRDLAPAVPILVLTGSDDEELGTMAISLGAQDYLLKQSVKPRSLRRAVRYARERKKFEDTNLRLAAIQDFLSALAHDLKAPIIGADQILTVILAGHVGEFTEQQLQLVKVLKSGCQDQLSMVNRLIEIYQLEANIYQFLPAQVKIAAVIQEAVKEIKEKFQRDINFDFEEDQDGVFVEAHEKALLRLFSNVFENAIRHGDASRDVNVKVEQLSNGVLISTQNWGQSIPKGLLPNVFDRFYVGVPGKNYSARPGYGLYLSQLIVSQHKGYLRTTSSEAEGTVVSVFLPWNPASE